MRGALYVATHTDGLRGIILADAGSTDVVAAKHVVQGGSSSRMRGAPGNLEQAVRNTGIILADAGSTLQSRIIRTLTTDHPRGCGEHIIRVPRPV